MTPTRILPDLQCSLLCEEVRQEASGNFFRIGVINFIRVPQLPVVAFKLSIFNRWTAGIGKFTESVRLIAPETLVIDDPTFPQFQRPGPVAVAVASPDDAPSVLCSAPARTDLLRVKPRQIQLASKPGSTEQRPPLHDFAVLNRPGDMPLMVLMEDDPPGLRLRLAGMDTTQVPWLPIHLPDKLVKLNATDSVRMSVVDSKSTVHEIVLLSPNGLSLVRLTLGVTAATVDLAEQPDVVGRDAVWIDGSQGFHISFELAEFRRVY